MALSTLSRSLISLLSRPHISLTRIRTHLRPLSSSSSSSSSGRPISSPFINTTASFDWSSSDEDEDKTPSKPNQANPSNLPPPYDPFSKKPTIAEPSDPTNLQEIFHTLRTSEGLTNSAIKMFDFLSSSGLTDEALALFSVIKDKGTMPDVVAHTAVVEAYANAGGQSKQAIRTFQRMLASGVLPNVYTYSVLIKGLAKDGRVGDARRYLVEMMAKGMRPNAGTYVAVFEGFVREEKVEEGRGLLEEMKGMGFVPDEKGVREVLDKRGQMFRRVMELLFGN